MKSEADEKNAPSLIRCTVRSDDITSQDFEHFIKCEKCTVPVRKGVFFEI